MKRIKRQDNSLIKIENEISVIHETEQNNTLAFGDLLEKIATKKIYLQAGCKSFDDYLKSNRLPFPSSTASEYRTMFRAWQKYKVPLSNNGFTVKCGTRKLLKMDEAWRAVEDKKELIQNMIKMSLRDFDRYVDKVTHKSEPTKSSEIVGMLTPENQVWDKILPVRESHNKSNESPKELLKIFIQKNKVLEIAFFSCTELKNEIEKSVKSILLHKGGI